MMKQYAPTAVWPVPEAFRGIYAHAVEVRATSRVLLISGQIGVEPDGTVPSSFEDQCDRAMTNAEELLAAADMTVADIVKVSYYLTRQADLPALNEARSRRWKSDAPPAVTTLVVAALARPNLLVEIEVVAASIPPGDKTTG
jgi:enamine deaminase RidA (YjgF/YER057c/UK114 family)